ncbi:MAG: single-stranded-DNA-specific exonuclease RecJ [Planctomycetota bacterium]
MLTESPSRRTSETEPALRGRSKRWLLPQTTPRPATTLLERVLCERRLAEDPRFLEPSLHHLHDPSLLPGLERAAELILQTVDRGDPLVVYGDYDVDGVTATAILIHTLRALAPEWASQRLTSYVPHRVSEGYGLHTEALRSFAEQGIKTVVTVDCGITAVEPARAARELGLTLIVTDHHNADEHLPDAAAVVHPGLAGSEYPFDGLCGAGVAYKLAWRLCTMHAKTQTLPKHLKSLLVELLSFATLGTIADMVPLVDENRAIATFGLARIRRTPLIGLRALVRASGLDNEKVGEEDVGFKLAPRLNAVGRLGHARDALELFLTDDAARAAELAELLSNVNDQRRATERRIFEQACEMVGEAGMDTPERRAIVLAHDEWHPGVVGIVASRLVERFARPTLLLARDGSACKGSGRTLDGFNLHAAIGDCSEHLTRFGGHDAAAGLALDAENLDAFTAAFVERVNSRLAQEDLAQTIRIDVESNCGELSPAAVRQLDALRPFGRGNRPVVVLLRGVRLVGPPETFGREGAHLALRVSDGDRRGTLRAIAWRAGGLRSSLYDGQQLDLAVRPEVSSFSGRVEPVIEDIRTTNTPI